METTNRKQLLIFETLVVIAVLSWLGGIGNSFGLSWNAVLAGRAYTILSYPFIHTSTSHLLLNIIPLFLCGRSIQRSLMSKEILFSLFSVLILGSGIFLVYDTKSTLIGLSGISYGTVGLLCATMLSSYKGSTYLVMGFLSARFLTELATDGSTLKYLSMFTIESVATEVHLVSLWVGFVTGILVVSLRRRTIPSSEGLTYQLS